MKSRSQDLTLIAIDRHFLSRYAKESEWVIEGDRIMFSKESTSDKVQLNSMELIKNTLHYAKEIERIV